MERRYNRRALMDGIARLAAKSDYRLLMLLYSLWRYILGEDLPEE